MASRDILKDAEIKKRLTGLPDWSKNGKSIKRSVKFDTYQQGIDFVCILAELADGCNHHPDIEIRENVVTLYCKTHRAEGVTTHDFDLANRIESLVADTMTADTLPED